MPKRPCGILVTPDNKTILCGDKFGDVYSLPLIPGEYIHVEEPEKPTQERTYNPTATNLTVHTQRNRKALEEQMKRKGEASNAREPLKFEHQLLLGHVSMLTDMQIGTVTVDGKARHHVITSDRDEHIRVSRGPPQAHIIERFCMGHTEFISFIRVLPKSNLLVSGGGDDWLGVWDWTSGKLISKHRLREGEGANVAVSGIWSVPGGIGGEEEVVCVAFEGTDLIYYMGAKDLQNPLPEYQSVSMGAPVLDVASTSKGELIVSLDTKEVSTTQSISVLHQANLQTKDKLRLRPFRASSGGGAMVVPPGLSKDVLKDANAVEVPVTDRRALDAMLYSVEKLRKRGDEDGLEED